MNGPENFMVCRLCLAGQKSEIVNIFHHDIINLPHKILKCTTINMSSDDGLPTTACMKCIHMIDKIDTFINMCQHSNRFLREQIAEHNKLKSLDSSLKLGSVSKHEFHYAKPQAKVIEEDLQPQERCLGESEKNCLTYSLRSKKKFAQNFLKKIDDGNELKAIVKKERICLKEKNDECSDEEESGEINKTPKTLKELKSRAYDSEDNDIDNLDNPDSVLDTEMLNTSDENLPSDNVASLRNIPRKRIKYKKKFRKNNLEAYAEEDYVTLGYQKSIRVYKVDDSIREIIGENIYACDICGTKFDIFCEFFDHQETHNGQSVFGCDKCEEVFDERKQLVEHDSRHKIACEICRLEVLPKSMSAHLLLHTDVHKCPDCGMRHTSNASLEKHIKARHTGIKGFVCHVCGKQSSCQSSMNRHMAYHSSERPYKCRYCDFCAKSLNIVQVHTSRKHFAEKCVCEICAKLFKSQPSLVQHMKRIHTARKHICDICGKAFIERYNLTRHLKKHAVQRFHECKACHKEFLTVRKLKEHMHSHRQGCVNCPKCGKEFFYKKYFSKHVLKCNENYCIADNCFKY